jgi:hypothetical protein
VDLSLKSASTNKVGSPWATLDASCSL